jgi:hypothetical protein
MPMTFAPQWEKLTLPIAPLRIAANFAKLPELVGR